MRIGRLSNSFRRSRVALCCALVASCTYGPPSRRVTIDGAVARMDTRTFGAIIRTEVVRAPSGLSKFPDGGAEKKVEQVVTAYAGDVDSGTVRPLGKVSAPKEVWTAFQATLLGLKSDGVYAVLTGCSRSSCGTAAPTRLYYRFGFDGTVQQLDHQPVDVERQPGMLSRSPGEETYTRVSTHVDSVTAVTVDNGPFIARFVVDSSGALIPIPPSAKRRASGAPNR